MNHKFWTMRTFPIQIISLALMAILITNCDRSDNYHGVPACVEKELTKKDSIRKPAEVWRWDVDDKTYYYFRSECCDQYNYLFNDNCEMVCAPDGGFSGKGDGTCPQFEGQIEKTLIWKDESR
jgi:hypothetical protein